MGEGKKIRLWLVFVFLLVLLSGCGAGNGETAAGNENAGGVSFQSAWVELDDLKERPAAAFWGDYLYYTAAEGEESGAYELRRMNLTTKETETLPGFRPVEEGRVPLLLHLQQDGGILLLDRAAEGAERQESQGNQDSSRNHQLHRLDADGAILDSFSLEEYLHAGGTSEDSLPPQFQLLAADQEGLIYLTVRGEEDQILVLNEAGELAAWIPAEGTVEELWRGADGRVYGIVRSHNIDGVQQRLYTVDGESGELTEGRGGLPEDIGTIRAAAMTAGGALISSTESIYTYDPDSETSTLLTSWLIYGADYGDIVCIGVMEDGGIAALLSYYSEGERVTEALLLAEAGAGSAAGAEGAAGQEDAGTGGQPEAGLENGQEQMPAGMPQTLTLATFNLDVMMQGYIADYNKAHPECAIEVIDYGGGEVGVGLTRLNADLAVGNVPDLIDLSDVDAGLYASLGILADLSPYLEAEGLGTETLLDSALTMYAAEGKVYGIPAGVMAETLMAYGGETVGRGEWTMEAFRAAADSLPEGAEIIHNLSAIGMLRIQLSMNMDQYIDYETGTCSFDGEAFRELLEFAMTIEVGGDLDVPEEEWLADGTLILHRAYLDGVSAFVSEAGLFRGESVQCVGYPSADGGHAYLTPYGAVGITEACEDKEAAWDFVGSLLTEEFQRGYMHFQIPTLRSVIEKELEEAQEMERNMQESDPSYVPVLSEENIEAFWEMAETGKATNSFNRDVWNIIEEEAEPYLAGERTLDETVELIQNRAEIFVSENWG